MKAINLLHCSFMIDNKKYFGKENIFVTGRATTGLYLILLKEGIKNKKILFPANICYAPVFAAVFLGNKPAFVDIADWANTSLKKIQECFDKDIACIVLPHMYGKVVKDVQKISDFCHKNGILFIEDCSSAFGASFNDKQVGSFGDYSIFSFGYSKIVDVGFGGIIASNKDLSCFEELQENLPFLDSDIEESLSMFSRIYRVIRNSSENSLTRSIYNSLPEYMSKYFLFRLSDEEKQTVLDSLKNIEFEKEKRWNAYNSYVKEFNNNENINVCIYETGDIPWRFSFTYEGDRKGFVSFLLENSIPISSWYPFIGSMFGIKNRQYENTVKIEMTIYNLTLKNDGSEWIKIINKFFEIRKVIE